MSKVIAFEKQGSKLQLQRIRPVADLTLICQGIEFKVHRDVVCPKSLFLNAACTGPWREALSGRVEFPEEDPDILSLVIHFLYTDDFKFSIAPDFWDEICSGNLPAPLTAVFERNGVNLVDDLLLSISTKVHVYRCADYLGIDRLKQRVAENIVRTVPSVINLAGFDEILNLIYKHTDTDDLQLRLAVTRLCVDHYLDITCSNEAAGNVIAYNEPEAWIVAEALLGKLRRAMPTPGLRPHYLTRLIRNYRRQQLTGIGPSNALAAFRRDDMPASCGTPNCRPRGHVFLTTRIHEKNASARIWCDQCRSVTLLF